MNKHFVPYHGKLYTLKYVAHELREKVFKEKEDRRNKAKAQNWMNAVVGKYHIKEMDESEVLHLLVELHCKNVYGKSLKSLLEGKVEEPKPKPVGSWRKIFKIPKTKSALFFGIMKYK